MNHPAANAVPPVTPTGPLSGLTVVDTTSMVMGPYCTMILGQMGARVVKVEPPGGDIARGIDDRDGANLGPIFLNANRGKESIVLDLQDPVDAKAFEKLVAVSDVIVHNRPAGREKRIGMDYEHLAAINPRVIVCGVRGFSPDGPYGPLPAYDDVIQGYAGVAAHQSGDGEPQYVRTIITDKVTALLAVGAICAALYERERSGEGQQVDVPMYETIVQFLLLEQQGAYIHDPPRGPAGYARTNSPFRTPMKTTDGMISLLPSTNDHWAAVFRILGKPDFVDDPRFRDISSRTVHVNELYRWMREEIAHRDTDELLEALRRANVPAGPVNSIADLFEDSHLNAIGFFEHVFQPGLGPLRQARSPLVFSRTGLGAVGPSPVLDQHGRQICEELGVARTSDVSASESE